MNECGGATTFDSSKGSCTISQGEDRFLCWLTTMPAPRGTYYIVTRAIKGSLGEKRAPFQHDKNNRKYRGALCFLVAISSCQDECHSELNTRECILSLPFIYLQIAVILGSRGASCEFDTFVCVQPAAFTSLVLGRFTIQEDKQANSVENVKLYIVRANQARQKRGGPHHHFDTRRGVVLLGASNDR